MTLEFRILGPLEVSDETGHVALGGPRQRGLLVILLLEAGRVVPTERLVDLLWGESAPKTATASLQNSVGRLRRALGADVLETKPPGYLLRTEGVRVDAHAFEQGLADARRLPAAERRDRLAGALALWRGPALADFAFDDFAQAEIRRLEELRLVVLGERIDAELELGQHADVVAELESLARDHPAPRDLSRAADARALPVGPAGGGARCLSGHEPAFVDELGIEPGPELQHLQAAILRQGQGSPPGTRRRLADDDAEIIKAMLAGRVVPVLGLDVGE